MLHLSLQIRPQCCAVRAYKRHRWIFRSAKLFGFIEAHACTHINEAGVMYQSPARWTFAIQYCQIVHLKGYRLNFQQQGIICNHVKVVIKKSYSCLQLCIFTWFITYSGLHRYGIVIAPIIKTCIDFRTPKLYGAIKL